MPHNKPLAHAMLDPVGGRYFEAVEETTPVGRIDPRGGLYFADESAADVARAASQPTLSGIGDMKAGTLALYVGGAYLAWRFLLKKKKR